MTMSSEGSAPSELATSGMLGQILALPRELSAHTVFCISLSLLHSTEKG